jgi:putative RNA 2'-phosphotransferase
MARHHVHLSSDIETATRVGARHGRPTVFEVDAAAMHADGYEFFVSANGVWLVERVPPEYLRKI